FSAVPTCPPDVRYRGHTGSLSRALIFTARIQPQPPHRRKAAAAHDIRRRRRALFLMRVGTDISPELPDLLVAEHFPPPRHPILAVAHRVLEARAVVRAQAAQVEGLTGADQAIA